MSRIRQHHPALALIGAALAWGLATVISKRAVEEIPPLALLPIQLTTSVITMGVVLRTRRRHWARPQRLGRLAVLGVLNPGVSYALSLLGLTQITASMSVLLWALEPVLILIGARLLLHEQLPTAVKAGAVVALTGTGLIIIRAGAAGTALGIVLTLAGVGACAGYTLACRALMVNDAALPVVVTQQAAALIFAVILLVAVRLPGVATANTSPLRTAVDVHGISATAWAAAILSGVVYYGVAFWLYLTGLHATSASTAGLYLTLIPVTGVTAGALLLHDHLNARQWAGTTLIILAVTAVAALRNNQMTPAPT
jgi:probable blue pigment (indigoidine) exporter